MKKKKRIAKICTRRRKSKKQKSPTVKVKEFKEKVLSGEIVPDEGWLVPREVVEAELT
ncbi:MAG: hypothetical protein UT26_C0032G0001 [Microgenomates group bacterium GW2011_GWC1_39_12]|nr:MAG: hypothetical protein UT26_C0032G0001 [Microgenomates group bacterium GW2011_GWC1_39_12]